MEVGFPAFAEDDAVETGSPAFAKDDEGEEITRSSTLSLYREALFQTFQNMDVLLELTGMYSRGSEIRLPYAG